MARALWALIPLSLASAALAILPERLANAQSLPSVPNKFIIEVDELARFNTKRSFTRALDAAYSSIRERDVAIEVNKEFDAAGIFVGASITVADVTTIQNIQGIKSIRPVILVDSPKPAFQKAVTSRDDPAIPAYARSTHVMTGVDKVHAEGLSGNGIRIGVIDTGIDYRHPALGGGFGPGKKVAGGYDFVGDDYTGKNQPVPDDDPLDCQGHGTHVAGIVGANPDNEFDILGVAPNATLYAYRVFGCVGQVQDDILVEAFLLAHAEGNDIITASVGGAAGWTGTTGAVVASRIARAGKIVTIGAGNDGADGAWYTSSPATGIDAIAVASVENTLIPLQTAIVHGAEHDPIELPIYLLSNSTIANDACDPLPASVPDLSTYLVIIRRGTCPFVQKLTNAAAKGAKYALIYDNGSGFNAIEVGTFAGRASLIRAEDGLWLLEQWVAGVPITVSFPQTGGSVDFPLARGGLMSEFSTYGPTNDFYFKPSLAAPGGNILSTVPDNGFAIMSGTSMATPFAAGAGALLLEFKGKSAAVARSARTLFQTTAKLVPVNLADSAPSQTLIHQGAGLINVYDAFHSTTLLSTGELVLNDTANFKPVHTFRVTNSGTARKDYTTSHVPAGTALTFIPGTHFIAPGPVPLSSAGATVAITPATFSLAPGGSREISVRFTAPAGLDASTFPVFSGFIRVTGTSETPVHVSYLGAVGSLENVAILDTTDEVLPFATPVLLDSNGEIQVAATNYTFSPVDYPSLLWRQLFGTPLFRVDLVDTNTTVQSTVQPRSLDNRAVGGDRHYGPVFSFPFRPGKGSGTFAQVQIVGPIIQEEFISRNHERDTNPYYVFDVLDPVFANGTAIPNGQYRLLFRVLKVTGNRNRQEDYETWLSPIVGVQVPSP
ncbi:pyrolysin [Coprinellus micaceus]|uniref:Pyrolysin n=1 Tax=Coprinellus micaceus TaxID=71717 RepID=A0A4Y7SIX7_COPMI|nr:pyrolysin [Coprinellus micaceus]